MHKIKILFSLSSYFVRLMWRDKLMFPALITAVGLVGFAGLASTWGTDHLHDIMFDIGYLGFHIFGCFVGIYWSSKVLADARSQGTIELQWVSPAPKWMLFLAAYFGVAVALLFLSIFTVSSWQALMVFKGYGLLGINHLLCFAMYTLLWLIVSGLTLCLSTFCNHPTSLFGGISLWLIGSWTSLISKSISSLNMNVLQSSGSLLGAELESNHQLDTANKVIHPFFEIVVDRIALVWDLQRFNYGPSIMNHNVLMTPSFLDATAYGASLIFMFLCIGILIFTRRELV